MSLKEFSIGEKLGQGAYSTVFKVQRFADKQVYALKKVKLVDLSEKQIENALNEVRILASIKNNYIVGYKQAFLEGRSLCIIMQFADDGDLYQKIVQRKKKNELFEQSEIWSVLIQSVIGLKSLHSLNILHRDLKSANIFLNKKGQAKLGDMNVSKIAKNGLLYTQTGTPYYASPQVWKDQPYDAKSDIWSLGCVIYEMTTLQPPFQAEDMEGLFKAVTLGVYPPINSKFSKQLGHIIKLMLQQKSKTRPAADKIVNSTLIQKKIQEFSLQNNQMQQGSKSELLKTIRIPKKLHYLTDRLPKPTYENILDDKASSSLKNSPILQDKQRVGKGNKSSLPKLSQILQPGISYKPMKAERSRKKKVSGGGGLIIQGRSKIIEQAKSQEKHERVLQRQIRNQLRKIYKVRGGGRSQEHKNKKSDRSIVLPPIRL